MNSTTARNNMLTQQIRACDVLDEHLLELIDSTPRELFVPETFQSLAYADTSIPIGHEQVMMTPKDEGVMLQALAVKPTDTILEIGTGSAYVTALLAKLGKYVYSVDIQAEFSKQAKAKLDALNLHNVTLETGDAARGWEKHAPYDVICITGSMPLLAASYRQNLKPGGRLFAVTGQTPVMEACLIEHDGETFHQTLLFETDLKPLLNAPEQEPFTF